MFETTEALHTHLLSLETALQRREVRNSEAELRELLAPDFREFGRSGAAYMLDEILTSLSSENGPDNTSISNFTVVLLSETVALATYRGIRNNLDGSRIFTNRSSIWRQDPDAGWRMVFHQGTPTS